MGTRNRRLRPVLVRLALDGTRLLAGEPRDAIPSLAGSGGRKSYRWVVWGPPAAKVTLSVDSETGGVESRVLELK
jgi:hypothetical protein